MIINLDGNSANKAKNKLYRGIGMVSGNNSSRLLLDYKSEHPERYWEILNLIFGQKGINVTHLKLEMGSDINSTSGTEPAIKRTLGETPDVTRGAGYQLAADAKKINPDLALDMLWWSEPTWIDTAEDKYDARYAWYKQTLDSAYETYGIKFDYVSANQNERQLDVEWIKYLSKRIKSEQSGAYDFSKIKIVAADEDSAWWISYNMLADEALRDAVDIIGSHYTSHSDENTRKLCNEYGKEIWFSEASSPMSYAKGIHRVNGTGSGLTGLNGFLDIANRFIAMYPLGDMTLHQYQPVVAAYYDGVTFSHKQLINACDPWSGYYTLDSGFYLTLHFSQFFRKGWTFIDSACTCDGKKGGDGHAIVDVTQSYMSACDCETGDYSVVMTNSTGEPLTYELQIKALEKASAPLFVWETKDVVDGVYQESFFKRTAILSPQKDGDIYKATVTLSPYSMVTISTLDIEETDYSAFGGGERELLALPYTDDFEYQDYSSDYLKSRGFAPRYTTDEGGAFEVASHNGNHVLQQKITPETLAKEWGRTPDPTTNLGDDRWFDYGVSVDVLFDDSVPTHDNYVGVGLRYNLGDYGTSGYWLQLFRDGRWRLNRKGEAVKSGSVILSYPNEWQALKLEAEFSHIKAYINCELVVDYSEKSAILSAGRISLFSSLYQNMYDNLKVYPLSERYFITRFDNTDELVSYEGEWTHHTMGSFKNYKRTLSEGTENAKACFNFVGSGFSILGLTEANCRIQVKIDGEIVEQDYSVPHADFREITYANHALAHGEHHIEVLVLGGKFGFDAIEILP